MREELELTDKVIKQSRWVNLTGHVGNISNSKCPNLENEEPIDVVFTWVNGSDPHFLEQLNEAETGSKTHIDDIKAQRFEGIIRRLLVIGMTHR